MYIHAYIDLHIDLHSIYIYTHTLDIHLQHWALWGKTCHTISQSSKILGHGPARWSISARGKYINVALLNHTVVVLFEDSSPGFRSNSAPSREILNEMGISKGRSWQSNMAMEKSTIHSWFSHGTLHFLVLFRCLVWFPEAHDQTFPSGKAINCSISKIWPKNET